MAMPPTSTGCASTAGTEVRRDQMKHAAAQRTGCAIMNRCPRAGPMFSGVMMRSLSAGPMFARLLLGVGLLLAGLPALAQDTDALLPVTEAYQLSADAGTPGVLKLHWKVAPDYYLYRGRMKFKAGDGVTLGQAQLPEGRKYHDEYLGDVETYHHDIDASIPYTVATGTTRLKLSVQYQGCHEVDPKICYPPHTEKLDLALPAATGGAVTPSQDFGKALRAINRKSVV